jgi:hypothetical protein
VPLLLVVDPTRMRVRAKVNQADVSSLQVGQPALVHLDAYPDASFPARLDALAPIAATSGLSAKVRSFVAVFSIAGTSSTLLPDLSAAVDVEVERIAGVLVAPRDAVSLEGGKAAVRLSGSSGETRPVTLGSRSDLEVVITRHEAGAAILRAGSERPPPLLSRRTVVVARPRFVAGSVIGARQLLARPGLTPSTRSRAACCRRPPARGEFKPLKPITTAAPRGRRPAHPAAREERDYRERDDFYRATGPRSSARRIRSGRS